MFYVYVLRSLRNNKRYVGYTARPPLDKLAEHNMGSTRWARQNRPFILLHTEEFENSTEARKRELFLKSGKGRQLLDEMFPRLSRRLISLRLKLSKSVERVTVN